MTKSNPKYYSYEKLWKRYRISKKINGKQISYGTYSTEKEAQQVVKELIKKDWDKKELPLILERLGIKSKIKKE